MLQAAAYCSRGTLRLYKMHTRARKTKPTRRAIRTAGCAVKSSRTVLGRVRDETRGGASDTTSSFPTRECLPVEGPRDGGLSQTGRRTVAAEGRPALGHFNRQARGARALW